MDTQTVLLGVAGSWAFCRFLCEPIATFAARRRLAVGRAGGLGWLAVAQLMSRILFLATLSGLLAFGLSWWLRSNSGLGLTEVNLLLDRIADVQDRISQVGTAWGAAATLIIATGLCVLAYSTSKSKEKRLVKEAWDEEFSRLQDSLRAGEWEELPPTPDMQKMQHHMDGLAIKHDLALQQGNDEQADAFRAEFDRFAQIHLVLDAHRRANVSIDPAEVAIKPKRSPLGLISSIFYSKGVVSGLGTGTRLLASAGLLLLLPSLLAATYQATEPDLSDAISSLESRRAELRLEIDLADLDRSYEDIVGAAPAAEEDEPLDEDTEESIYQTAQILDSQVFPRVILRSIAQPVRDLDAVNVQQRRTAARKEILEIRAASARGAPATVTGGLEGAHFDGLSLADTPTSEATRAELRKLAKSNPSAFSRLKQNAQALKASFTTPASARQMERALVSQIVGHAIDTLPAIDGLDPAVDRQIKAWAGEIPSLDAQRAHDAVLKKFVVAGTKESAPLDWSEFAAWEHSPLSADSTKSLQNSLAEFERAMPAESRIASELPSLSRAAKFDESRAASAASRMANRLATGPDRPAFVANALTSFEDHFPGSAGSELKTSQARIGQAIAGPRASPPPVPSAAGKAAVRARSYGHLRGFSRIGGVLIGREPDDPKAVLPLRGIDWQRTGGQIEIRLLEGETSHSIGRFNPAIVQLALAYAADGRPTTVTMVTTDVIPDLRILLHPALEDTGLGCRAIRLDQLADELSSVEGGQLSVIRAKADERIRGEIGLYRLAWRARARTSLPLSGLTGEDRTFAEQLIEQADFVAEEKEAHSIVSLASQPLLINRKPEFFDQSLIRQMEACLPSLSVRQFDSCIEQSTSSIAARTGNYSWLAPPPEYQIWSGVRELPYQLDGEFSFLRSPTGSKAWPFRFMVQVAFESEALFAGGASSWTDEHNAARDEYVDYEPWEIEDVSASLSRAVEARIRSDADTADVVSSMSEFAVLQRLFRNALDGRFGPDFPTDRLVELASETAEDVNPDALTAQWLRSPGNLEYQLYSRTGDILEDMHEGSVRTRFISRISDCMIMLEDILDANRNPDTALESISGGDWEQACVFTGLSSLASGNSDLEDLEHLSTYVSEARNLRAAVGATAAANREYPDRTGKCPRL